MRKFGEVRPEPNNGQRITIPIKTRTPIEAFNMFRAGQPVDNMAGYYSEHGMDTTDFHLMDKIDKLKALNNYREKRQVSEEEINSLNQILENEERERINNQTIPNRGNPEGINSEHNQSGQLLQTHGTGQNQTKVP